MPDWSTACPDWRERVVARPRRSLIPFDPLFADEAEAALEIFRGLKIVDAAGGPTMGAAARQWVFEFVAAIFGAYDKETGRRLIRYFFLLISKKNAKSTIAAGIMVTALIRNWRESGEFYILAPTKEIADNSYFPARDMVNADSTLKSLLKPRDNYRTIEHLNTGAFLKVVAADNETVSGKKTIGLLVDELWLFGKRANASNLLLEATGGLASRPEGFVIYLSTQSDGPPAGVFASKLDEFRAIRDGEVLDPGSLPVLYEFPPELIKGEAFRRPENWYVTNPNLGASVDEHYIGEQLAKAERAGRAEVVGFLAKHLNVQIGMSLRADGWAGAALWERGFEEGLTLDAILERSEVVTVGIDGGGLDDLLGVSVMGREQGTLRWLSWSCAFISPEGWERRKANETIYQEFCKTGELMLVEDLQDDVDQVVDIVGRVNDTGLLAQVGVDPAGLGILVDALGRIGITEESKQLVGVRQGIALMGAIKAIERKLVDGSFRHGGQKLMAWCAGNAIVQPTPTGMRIARDASGYGKIDPLMAMFDAAALMAMNPQSGSVYTADRGLLIVSVGRENAPRLN